MSYDILKRLGLDHLDTGSPEFLQTLERLQKEAWQRLQQDSHPCGADPRADEIPGE